MLEHGKTEKLFSLHTPEIMLNETIGFHSKVSCGLASHIQSTLLLTLCEYTIVLYK